MANVTLHIALGETYDFEFQPQIAGEIPLQVKNVITSAMLMGRLLWSNDCKPQACSVAMFGSFFRVFGSATVSEKEWGCK
jgi:hypothetical protein